MELKFKIVYVVGEIWLMTAPAIVAAVPNVFRHLNSLIQLNLFQRHIVAHGSLALTHFVHVKGMIITRAVARIIPELILNKTHAALRLLF